jgi:hypothetical protein
MSYHSQHSQHSQHSYWLSFVDEEADKSLGVILVKASSFIQAVLKTHQLRINPGGQVLGYEVPEDDTETLKIPHNRLLQQEELAKYTVVRSIREFDEEKGEEEKQSSAAKQVLRESE